MSRTTIWHCSASRVYLCAVFSPSDAPQNFSNIRERSFQVMFLTNASSHRRPLMPYNPLEQPHAQRCTHVNCFGSILLHSTSYPSTPLCQCILCGIAPSGLRRLLVPHHRRLCRPGHGKIGRRTWIRKPENASDCTRHARSDGRSNGEWDYWVSILVVARRYGSRAVQ